MHEVGAKVLALEAQKSIAFDQEDMVTLANKYNISILGYTDDDMT
jgi:hypothetical protein